MKTKTVVALAIFVALLITAVAGAVIAPAPAAAAPGIATLAGAPGTAGTLNATGTAARFGYARGVAIAPSGILYVADTNNSTIRAITSAGVVTTLAGSPGLTGTANGTGAAARFNYPEGIAWDAFTGTLLVADTQNNMIREVTTGGVVSTITGQLGVGGSGSFVDGPIATAMFKRPRGVTAATNGTIYVGDSGNDAVRVITAARTTVSTLAGGLAVFNNPRGVVVDTAGVVYVADYNNHRIARITAAGVVSTWAGSGVQGSANGTGTAAQFNNPCGLARTGAGVLYVGDSGNNTIRAISTGRVVTTYAGSPPPTAAGSADGIFTAARFNDPFGVAVDSAGLVYVADRGNSTIRRSTNSIVTITATAGANGTITPAGVVGVPSGTNSTTFAITPNTGYHVASVLVNGASVGAVTTRTFTNITSNQTISATFAINTFTITPSGGGANGTITPNTVQTVSYGGSQTFTMAPSVGFRVANVLVDGVSVGAVASYTFSNVTANHTIAVSWGASSFTITSSTGANGTISPTPSVVVPAGGSQTFTMTPAANFHVANVVVDSVSIGNAGVNTYTFTNVLAAHTISVTFAANPVITPTAGPNGTITPSTATTVAYNGSQTFTIAGNAGFQISDVLVDGVSNSAAVLAGSYTFTGVIANHTISATFVPSTYTITPSVVGANGTITPNTVQTVTINGSSPAFTMTPATGYHILDVLIDGISNPTAVAAGTYTFTGVVANHTIAVSFAINTFTITPSAGPNGTITPGTPTSVNYLGSQTFTIAANAGYQIANVLVDGSSVGAVTGYSFTSVTANHTIWATFEAIPSLTLTSPSPGTSWPAGSTQSLGFTLSSAVSVGEFHGVLVDTVTGAWHYTGVSFPVAGQTVYSQSFSTASIPSGTYTAAVYYLPVAGAWGTPLAAVWGQFGGVTITGTALSITINNPSPGTSWPAGSTQSLDFTLSAAVGTTGEFHGVLVNTVTGAWYYTGVSFPIVGQTIFSQSFSTIGIPTGAYTAAVYYLPAAGAWGTPLATVWGQFGGVTIF